MVCLLVRVLQAFQVAVQCRLKFAHGQLSTPQHPVVLPQDHGISGTQRKGAGFVELEDGRGILRADHQDRGLKAHGQCQANVVFLRTGQGQQLGNGSLGGIGLRGVQLQVHPCTEVFALRHIGRCRREFATQRADLGQGRRVVALRQNIDRINAVYDLLLGQCGTVPAQQYRAYSNNQSAQTSHAQWYARFRASGGECRPMQPAPGSASARTMRPVPPWSA